MNFRLVWPEVFGHVVVCVLVERKIQNLSPEFCKVCFIIDVNKFVLNIRFIKLKILCSRNKLFPLQNSTQNQVNQKITDITTLIKRKLQKLKTKM